MTDELLFNGAHLRARLFNGHHPRLLATFDFRHEGRGGFIEKGPARGFDRHGWAQLMVRVARNDWFVNAETEALEVALAPVAARYERVQGLGYSMGGYGAFRFAQVLGAQAVVAVSPQVSIHPEVVPFDRRYRRESAGFDPALGDLSTRAMSALGGVILVDPWKPLDLVHARLLQEIFPGVRIARVAGGGHPATGLLGEAGRGWVVQREARSAPPRAQPILSAHRAARSALPSYWHALARRAEPHRPDLAARARARAAEAAEGVDTRAPSD